MREQAAGTGWMVIIQCLLSILFLGIWFLMFYGPDLNWNF